MTPDHKGTQEVLGMLLDGCAGFMLRVALAALALGAAIGAGIHWLVTS